MSVYHVGVSCRYIMSVYHVGISCMSVYHVSVSCQYIMSVYHVSISCQCIYLHYLCACHWISNTICHSLTSNTLKSMSVYHVSVSIYTICVPVTNQEVVFIIIDSQCLNLPLVSPTKHGDELFFKPSVGRSLLLFSVRK